MPRERYLNSRRAAEYIGYAQGTLKNWRALGTGPEYSRTSTGSIRYAISALEAFMSDGEDDDE